MKMFILFGLITSIQVRWAEVGRYRFGLDLGEVIPDRSGQDAHIVNGSTLDYDNDNLPQKYKRGLYMSSGGLKFVKTPNNAHVSNKQSFNDDFTISCMVKADVTNTMTFISYGNDEDKGLLISLGICALSWTKITTWNGTDCAIEWGTFDAHNFGGWHIHSMSYFKDDTGNISIRYYLDEALSQTYDNFSLTRPETDSDFFLIGYQHGADATEQWRGFVYQCIVMHPHPQDMTLFGTHWESADEINSLCWDSPWWYEPTGYLHQNPSNCGFNQTSDWSEPCDGSWPDDNCHRSADDCLYGCNACLYNSCTPGDDDTPCVFCPINCVTCDEQNQCTRCPQDAGYDESVKDWVCLPGTTSDPNADTLTWIAWHDDWQECTTETCTLCKDAHAQTDSESPTSCICIDGWYDSEEAVLLTCRQWDVTCSTCVLVGCQTWEDENASTVLNSHQCQWNEGWYISPYLSTCQPWNATCVSWNSAQWLSCYDSQASPTGKDCEWNEGWFDNLANPDVISCLQCDTTCTDWTAQSCSTCVDSNASGGFACTCNAGYYPNPTATSCSPCQNTCAQCTADAACTVCEATANATVDGTICVCNDGWYAALDDASNCLQWDETWANCNASEWFTCKDSNASPTGATCTWNDGWRPESTASTCVQWSGDCKRCSQIQCEEWYDNALLDLGDDTWIWSEGFYENTTAANWSSWDSTWSQCDINRWTTWMDVGAEVNLDDNFVCNCRQGFYPDPTPDIWRIWSDFCQTCEGAGDGDCNHCKDNASLDGESPSTCSWNAGYFLSNFNCLQCHEACASCTGETDLDCTSWNVQYVLNPTNSANCLTSCPDGYYQLTQNGLYICRQCQATCATCDGPTSSDWITCVATGKERNNDPTGTCQCSQGTFENTSDLDSDDTWLSCDQNWSTCASYPLCLTWDDANASPIFTDSATEGEWQCNEQFYNSSTSGKIFWSSCFLACQNWTGSNSDDWIAWADANASVDGGQCKCNPYFYDSDASDIQTCTAWDSTWVECNGNFCVSCEHSNTVPSAHICLCEDGWYPNSDITNCSACHFSCARCTASECLECKHEQAVEVGLECQCQEGFYPNTDATTCSPCVNTCNSCTADTCLEWKHGLSPVGFIWECNSGYYFSSSDTAGSGCYACDSSCLTWSYSSENDCTSWKGSAIFTGSSCSCTGDGTFGTTEDCQEWEYTCKTCIGSTAWDCASWYDNAHLQQAYDFTGIYRCACDTNYTRADNAGHCEPTCQSTCLTWADVDVCGSCYEGASVVGVDCSCGQGWYGSADNCQPCDDAWESCDGPGKTSCENCALNYYMQTPVSTSRTWVAQWPGNQYKDNASKICADCHDACGNCTGSSETQCTSCSSNFYLQPNNSTTCRSTCPDGYYPEQGTNTWRQWHVKCAACISASRQNCTTCKSDLAVLTDGECICQEGTASMLDGTCAVCHSDWATWIDTDVNFCLSCLDSVAVPLNGVCSWQEPFVTKTATPLEWACPNESQYDNDTQHCELEWQLGFVAEDFVWVPCPLSCSVCHVSSQCTTCVDGYFLSAQLQCEQCAFPCTTCRYEADDCSSCIDEQILVNGLCQCNPGKIYNAIANQCQIPTTYTMTQEEDDGSISITFSNRPTIDLTQDDVTVSGNMDGITYYLQSINGQQYKIQFEPNAPDKVNAGLTDNYKDRTSVNEASTNSNVGYLFTAGQQDDEEITEEEEQKAEAQQTTESASNAVVGTTVVASIFFGNPAQAWKIINFLQAISLFQYVNLETTPVLDGFLSSLLKESQIPNIYDLILPSNFDSVEMPDRFKQSGYKYPLYMDIFGHVFTLQLAIFAVLFIASIMVKTGTGKFKELGQKVYDKLAWNGVIRSQIQSAIYLFLGVWLNIKYASNLDDPHVSFNLVLGILAISSMAFGTIFLVFKVMKYSGDFSNPAFIKYNELVKEMNTNASDFGQQFYALYLLRRLLLILIVVFLENAKLQISLMFFINIMHFLWLLVDQPFDSHFANCIEIFEDLILLILSIGMFTFINSSSTSMAYAIIFLVISGIFAYYMLILHNFVEKCKSRCTPKSNDIHPETDISGSNRVSNIQERFANKGRLSNSNRTIADSSSLYNKRNIRNHTELSEVTELEKK